MPRIVLINRDVLHSLAGCNQLERPSILEVQIMNAHTTQTRNNTHAHTHIRIDSVNSKINIIAYVTNPGKHR